MSLLASPLGILLMQAEPTAPTSETIAPFWMPFACTCSVTVASTSCPLPTSTTNTHGSFCFGLDALLDSQRIATGQHTANCPQVFAIGFFPKCALQDLGDSIGRGFAKLAEHDHAEPAGRAVAGVRYLSREL